MKRDTECNRNPNIGKGTETRNWVYDTLALPRQKPLVKLEITEHIRIPTRDGIRLAARLIRPENAAGKPLPTLVQLNGYGHEGPAGAMFEVLPHHMARRGYAVLHVSMRGIGSSEGTATLYNHFAEDGHDVIEWAARQPWSTGKVGLIGESLLGISQWLAAKTVPPSLAAISPGNACADPYEYLWYLGGTLPGPGRQARGNPEYPSAIGHRDFDAWWQARSLSDRDLQNIVDAGIAVLVGGNWNDYISPGNVEAFRRLSRMKNSKAMLVMSDGAHVTPPNVKPYSYYDLQTLWFDHWLKGEKNAITAMDPVLLLIQGTGQRRFEKSWPLPDTKWTKLFFSNQPSASIASLNDGSLLREPQAGIVHTATYTYSSQKGPFLHTMIGETGRAQTDQTPVEAQTVTWTSEPLKHNTEVTGPLTLTFWAAIEGEDADFIVSLSDVRPDGCSTPVSAGYLNAMRAASRSAPEPVPPGVVRRYAIELQPVCYVFQKGHRLRVSIAGGSALLPGQQTANGPGLHPYDSRVTIHFGGEYPSHLLLPVIGDEL